MGVFATRSPFRPNHIGLSSVRLTGVTITDDRGPLLYVSGIDMRDNTPIYDIKPYLSYTDSHENTRNGFTDQVMPHELMVDFPKDLLNRLPYDKQDGLIAVLQSDARPSYHNKGEEDRIYGLSYAGFNIRFRVKDGLLKVIEVTPFFE